MKDIKYLIIHCSATKEGKSFDRDDMDRWHKRRGFRKIGYHYFIKLDGTIQKGRSLTEQGAHVRGYNNESIGICYCGGLDSNGKPKDTRTKEQLFAMDILLEALVSKYPDSEIKGHRDFSVDKNGNGKIDKWERMKACPCFDAIEYYDYL